MKLNLLQETLQKIEECQQKESDVLWCGSTDLPISLEKFKELAKDINYDNTHIFESDSPIIARDIFIVGSFWWLSREISKFKDDDNKIKSYIHWKWHKFPDTLYKTGDHLVTSLIGDSWRLYHFNEHNIKTEVDKNNYK